MKQARILIQKTALALLVGTVLGLARIDTAVSRDTDIYFDNPNAQQQAIKPNVLLILDTSGSMNWKVGNTNKTRLEHMKEALNTILDNAQNVKIGLMRFSGDPGGPVLFPVADIDASTATIEGEGLGSVSATLASGDDDAEETTSGASPGTVTLTSPDLDMVTQGDTQIVGVRFQNVQVPPGVTVTSAHIRFHVDETTSDATSLTIKGQNTGDAPAFTTATNNVSSRTAAGNATTASVAWAPPSWTVALLPDGSPDVDNPAQESTPDIKDIVNEIVNRSDWCSGNSMAFTIEGSGNRVAKSFDGSPAAAPVLVVNYDATSIPSPSCVISTAQVRVNDNDDDAEERVSNGRMDRDDDTLDFPLESGNEQYIGLRFENVPIPADTTIVSAHIDLTVDEAGSGSPSFRIVGQRETNPGSFTTSDRNISDRVNGAGEATVAVDWTGIPNPSANEIITTPNLKNIVQEIVDLSDWGGSGGGGGGGGWGGGGNSGGSNMVFVFTSNGGTGTRLIRSHDDNDDRAPLLRIRYQQQVDLGSATAMSVRNRLKQIVSSLEASGNTPVVDTLWEAGLYYRGKSVLYGKIRGPQSGTTARYTRVSHPATYSGEDSVYRASGCTDSNLSASECVSEEIEGSPVYTSPFEDGCQNSYIVLLTDGEPTVNNAVAHIEELLGASCAGSGDGKCSNELAKYYFDNNLSAFTDKHNVITHTIGFGEDVSSESAVAYLEGIATAGGGSFRPAGDAQALVSAFQEILSNVIDNPTSFVSPSLSVNAFNKLFNRDEVYFSLFKPQKNVRWPGNVKRFQLCNDSTNATCTFGEVLDKVAAPAVDDSSKIKLSAQSHWTSGAHIPDGPTVELGGAGQQIPARATRNVYTYVGNEDVPASPVNLANTPVTTTNVTKAMLGNDSMSDQLHTDIINWMRGQDIKNEDQDDPEDTSDDRWKFADALHSRPLTVSYGGTAEEPVIKLFVGTNDGALRMINTKNGVEEWAVYIPDFLKNQEAQMNNVQGVHIPGLDGTPTAYVIDHNNNGKIEPGDGDKVYVYIGERRGGRSVYAFDVTPDNEITDPSVTDAIEPKFLWRLDSNSTGFGALGETWSRPLLTKIRVKCASCSGSSDTELMTVLMFAGGYDSRLDAGAVYPSGSDTRGNAIYIVNPLNGSLVWRAGATSSGANLELANMNYAIPSDLALLDTDGDGGTDRIYAGDSRGQLWRIDLGSQIDPGQPGAGGSKGYVFADVSGASRQEHRKFFYPPEVVQVEDAKFSTEPNYDLVVIGTGDREDPLDKLTSAISTTEEPVHNRLYAFRDYNYKTGPYTGSTPPATLVEGDLYNATTNNLSTLTGTALDEVKSKKGWFIDLQEPAAPNWIGEKALARATVFDGKLMFTTFVPTNDTNDSSDVCAPLSEGIGRLYTIDYLTAAPVLDLDGDGDLDRYFAVGGGIPSEAVVVIREGGVTTLVGTSGGAANPEIELDLPRYTTYWYEE